MFTPVLELIRMWSSSPLMIFILLFSLPSLCLCIFRKQSKLLSAFLYYAKKAMLSYCPLTWKTFHHNATTCSSFLLSFNGVLPIPVSFFTHHLPGSLRLKRWATTFCTGPLPLTGWACKGRLRLAVVNNNTLYCCNVCICFEKPY